MDEAPAEAREDHRVRAGEAAELAVVAVRRNARVLVLDKAAGEAWMEEDGQVEVRRVGEGFHHAESHEARRSHDAVRSELLRLVGPVEEAQVVRGAVRDVERVPAGLRVRLVHGVRHGGDALFERRPALVEEAVVVLDEGAAAQRERTRHLRQLLRAPPEGLHRGHEDGARGHAAEVAQAALAELRPLEGALHGFRQLDGQEADARQEAHIAEEHVEEFREVALHGFRQVGDDRVVRAGLGFLQVFHMAHHALLDPRAPDEIGGAFHGLLISDGEGLFPGALEIGGLDAVGGGEALFLLHAFQQLFENLASEEIVICHLLFLSGDPVRVSSGDSRGQRPARACL